MSRISTGALRILGRLYRFVDGTDNVEQVEMGLPIQLVHDVAREVELNTFDMGPGVPGFFQLGQDNVHGAGGVLTASVDPYAVTDAAFGVGSNQRLWCWLMWAGLTQSAACLIGGGGAGVLTLQVAALGGALSLRDLLIARWNNSIVGKVNGAHANVGVYSDATGAIFTNPFIGNLNLPLLIPAGSTLGFRTDAAIAGTVRLSTICWCGPIGTLPPGI